MKKAIIAITLVMLPILLILVVVVMLFMVGSDDGNNALAGSIFDESLVDINPERIEELMLIKTFGVPSDIVMMITTHNSKTQEEALTKPFIFPALEFLIMTEDVKEFTHHHIEGKDPEDDDYHVLCGYETVEINKYEYKDAIKGYIGIWSEEYPSELNAGNLRQKAQEVADERSKNSDKDQIRIITFDAIPPSGYADAIKRCWIEKEVDIQRILDLHKSGYFTELLNNISDSLGINPGESTVIGGNTHNAIRYAMQNSDFVDETFFGGSAILPLQTGIFSITSEFGLRDFAKDPNHTGIDLAPPRGLHPPIYSVMDGIVLMRVTNMNTFGHHIVIFHGGKVTTMYAHMNAFGSFNVGDRVSKGDVIGYVGTTGAYSTGDHLHFEYQINGSPLNPREILPL